MAHSKQNVPGEDEETPEVVAPDEGKLKEADRVAGPYIEDAEANDPPVRTNRPDVPIAQTLATGAGAHRPVDDPDIDSDGRYRPRES